MTRTVGSRLSIALAVSSLTAGALAVGALVQAASADAEVRPSDTGVSRPETWMLIVTGLGGEPAYAQAFVDQGHAVAHHAQAVGAQVTLLTDQAARREAIRAAIAEIADGSTGSDAVVLHLIGHGTFDGEQYRFNVPGPDPTGGELALWLEPLAAKRQLAVVATSASGATQESLKHDSRTVITATNSGRERNATVFGTFWTDALIEPGADLDKDQRISADEAFRFAERAVANHFADQERIATEHPRLEGDATRFVVAHTAPQAPLDPALVHLVDRVDELTDAIQALRADRRVLTDDDYFARLQELLMELAAVDRELESRADEPDHADGDRPTTVPFQEDLDW